jgi:hypothetical protein
MYIGRLECHPIYKAKQGHLDAKTRRYRRFVRVDWQIRVNQIIARQCPRPPHGETQHTKVEESR